MQSVEKIVPDLVVLNEKKIKPKLSTKEGYNGELWYLDTGASNHMSGCAKMFAELDTKVEELGVQLKVEKKACTDPLDTAETE